MQLEITETRSAGVKFAKTPDWIDSAISRSVSPYIFASILPDLAISSLFMYPNLSRIIFIRSKRFAMTLVRLFIRSVRPSISRCNRRALSATLE